MASASETHRHCAV